MNSVNLKITPHHFNIILESLLDQPAKKTIDVINLIVAQSKNQEVAGSGTNLHESGTIDGTHS